MRFITFIFLFFICNQIFPQDCELKSFKDRREAKKIKDYKTADEIRIYLESHDILLEDSSEGTIWRKK